MTWLALIPCLLLAALPPLTGDQQQMLATTSDVTTSYEQPGLISLLANAKTWPDDPTANEAGSLLPDYADIRQNPAQWRGKSCLIEGTLISRVSLGLLTRLGYENVENWTIRVPNATTSGGGDIIIVALTHPPAVQWGVSQGQNTAPLTRDMKIRLAARFYTLYRSPDRDGKRVLDYPLFVGHSAAFPETRGTGDIGLRPLLLITLIFVMSAAYVIVIIVRIKRSRASRRRHEEEPARHRSRLTVERREDLPDDPIAAMQALEEEHKQQQD